MGSWQTAVQLEGGEGPVYRRIAAAILADIERGRLRAGDRLPSSRALALQLGVNRNTAIKAYDDLRAAGWIAGRQAKGMFVAAPSDRSPPTPARLVLRGRAGQVASGRTVGFDLPPGGDLDLPAARAPGLLVLLGGVPDLRFLPHVELSRAYRHALRSSGAPRLTDYADPRGDERLRAALGELLVRRRGIPAGKDNLCVVRGGQNAIYLAARALLRPGDAVAVEELGYQPAFAALRLAGADLCPVPVDEGGLDVGALEALCARRRLRAVYLTPHHQCPTTVTLAGDRRSRLLALAARLRLIVLEDDYDFDFHYDGRPVLPLAASDTAGVVVYLGTLSKSLAPGLRLGYVAAPAEVIRRIASYRLCVDRQGDHVLERAVATLLEDGVIQHHARRALRLYRSRRDLLCDLLRRRLPSLSFTPPTGGMAVWARAPGVDVDAWARRARAAGVAFQPASLFTFDGRPRDFVRIGFAACDAAQLSEATRRLAVTLFESV